MKNTSLVITSIANDMHPVLNQYAQDANKYDVSFIVIGDAKSPNTFKIKGCDFYSLERQLELQFKLSKNLPTGHYARKNIGYLVAIKNGAQIIVETDDDNIPLDSFWSQRQTNLIARSIEGHKGWVNVYKYFSESHIWPRGFDLERLLDPMPKLG